MALRAGLPLRDIEMVQFHPTGLLAGEGTRMTGTVLEEGLRGSGGYLTDAKGERFMFDYDARGERATRDIVSRSIMDRDRQRSSPARMAASISRWATLARTCAARVQRHGRTLRGLRFRSGRGRVEVIPTAHYMMGGVEFKADCTTETAGALCRRRGYRRRAWRQPAGRQRCRQFDRVRRYCRRYHGRRAPSDQAPCPSRTEHAIDAAYERAFAPLGRKARQSAGNARTHVFDHVGRRWHPA